VGEGHTGEPSDQSQFAAYMYEDPAFGPLVRGLPVSSLVAEAFGGYAGYTAGRGLGFRWFFLGGAIVGLVAMAVSHCESVMVNGPQHGGAEAFSLWASFGYLRGRCSRAVRT
jgi:hypothetical protein